MEGFWEEVAHGGSRKEQHLEGLGVSTEVPLAHRGRGAARAAAPVHWHMPSPQPHGLSSNSQGEARLPSQGHTRPLAAPGCHPTRCALPLCICCSLSSQHCPQLSGAFPPIQCSA